MRRTHLQRSGCMNYTPTHPLFSSAKRTVGLRQGTVVGPYVARNTRVPSISSCDSVTQLREYWAPLARGTSFFQLSFPVDGNIKIGKYGLQLHFPDSLPKCHPHLPSIPGGQICGEQDTTSLVRISSATDTGTFPLRIEVKLTAHLNSVTRLGIQATMTPFPPRVFMAWW
jgi:hypothetical protein